MTPIVDIIILSQRLLLEDTNLHVKMVMFLTRLSKHLFKNMLKIWCVNRLWIVVREIQFKLNINSRPMAQTKLTTSQKFLNCKLVILQNKTFVYINIK